jgi:hypothetical protein
VYSYRVPIAQQQPAPGNMAPARQSQQLGVWEKYNECDKNPH